MLRPREMKNVASARRTTIYIHVLACVFPIPVQGACASNTSTFLYVGIIRGTWLSPTSTARALSLSLYLSSHRTRALLLCILRRSCGFIRCRSGLFLLLSSRCPFKSFIYRLNWTLKRNAASPIEFKRRFMYTISPHFINFILCMLFLLSCYSAIMFLFEYTVFFCIFMELRRYT